MPREAQRVAIAGLGAVGMKIAKALDEGIAGFRLAAVSARDLEAAQARMAGLRTPVPVVPLGELEPLADLVIECAPAAALPDIARPFLGKGKQVIVLSAGALLANMDLVDLARMTGGQIIVPTGALIGLDAVTAAAEGEIHSVRMITRKPPKGLVGAPYLDQHGIDVEAIREPTCIFEGTPREAAAGFPANLNVAAALGLAGVGVDRTRLEIWADPTVERNVHSIEVVADSATFNMSIANVPSENPKTGRITALSVIAWLRKSGAPMRVGT